MTTLEKAVEILSDDERQIRCMILYRTCLPVYKAHLATITQAKGVEAAGCKRRGPASARGHAFWPARPRGNNAVRHGSEHA